LLDNAHMLDGEESNLSVKTQNSFTHCETVGHKVKLLDTLERALRAYESEAFPGISSELFRELVNDVQTLLVGGPQLNASLWKL